MAKQESNRKMVDVKEEVCGTYSEYTYTEMMERMKSMLDTLPENERSKARFGVDYEQYPYEENKTYSFFMLYSRLENDEEYKRRLAQEAKFQEDWERREQKEFERLSKKYGP